MYRTDISNTRYNVFPVIISEFVIIFLSKKGISVNIYDILTEYKLPEEKIDELIPKIVELAEHNL